MSLQRPLVCLLASRGAARHSLALAGLLLACGCAHRDAAVVAEASGSSAPASRLARRASAQLLPLGSSGVSGTLILTEVLDGGVKIEGQVHGLKPEGLHGFHVHAVGDCSASDGSSAGGHFNPDGQPHGDPAGRSHLGDLGNIQADHTGMAQVFVMKKAASLDCGASSLVGRALIVHKSVDDMRSQPAGNSGDRVACAVIKLSH